MTIDNQHDLILSSSFSAKLSVCYTTLLRGLIHLLAGIAGVGLLVMVLATCVDVVLRIFRCPLAGTYDIVKVAGGITILSAIPYTTAMKGHVIIEYFVQKLRGRSRMMVDQLCRILGIGLFVVLTWKSIQYGLDLRRNGHVTQTLQFPEYWIAFMMAVSCGVVALVILHNLFHPGKEIIKP